MGRVRAWATAHQESAPAWLFATLAVVVLLSRPAPVKAQQALDDDTLRTRVLRSIETGQQALIQRQNRNGSWSDDRYSGHNIGVTAIATLALLNSGLPAEHDSVARGLTWLRRADVDPTQTYDMSLVIMALTASGDRRGMGKVAQLASRLENEQIVGPDGGSWGYGAGGHVNPASGWRDNSNAQFAILGLREAAMAGVPVDLTVLERAELHFLRSQTGPVNLPQGTGWNYNGQGPPTGSMTVAGISSLSVTDMLLANDDDVSRDGQIDCCGEQADPVHDAIDSGTRWLSNHFRARSNPGTGQWPLYYLYGLERAGRFTGKRFFGDHDWYREGATWLVEEQSPREQVWVSSEESAVVGTSLALLFLSKGLSPVVINKLEFGPRDPLTGQTATRDWNRHRRDVSNLVEYISGLPQWPKLLTWQTVDLRVAADGEGVAALLQSPVQFISGADRPEAIQGRELELLRSYLTQGGFIFAVQNCDSAEFDTGFRDLVNRLFDGQYELRKLPPTHDVYRSEFLFATDTAPPELWGVDFGCRTAIIYAPYDHACRWDKWMKHDPPRRPLAVKTQIEKSMMLGTNVIAYATGRELLDKLQRPKVLTPAEEQQMNRGMLKIARVRHSGGWDTAPNALRRLKAALEAVNLEVAVEIPNLAANDPALRDYPLLYMHGRRNFQFTEEEKAGLRNYLESGGFLFADACCGSSQFDESFRALVEEVFGKPLERIPDEHEIYNFELGYDIRRVTRKMPASGRDVSSLKAEDVIGQPVLEGIERDGKYVLVYSKYDLSCALERQSTTACAGYPTDDAVRIGVNLVMYGLLQ